VDKYGAGCCHITLLFLVALIILSIGLSGPKRGIVMQEGSRSSQDIVLYGLAYPYTLPVLPYAFDALEPSIDARTMEIHLTKHHQGYIDKLNKTLEPHPVWQQKGLEHLLAHLATVPDEIRESVRGNGGGHFAHTLFWDSMTPDGAGKPVGRLATAIDDTFGSFDAFKERVESSGLAHLGSGWTWLCVDPAGALQVISTLNHDTPLAMGWYPLFVVDIWEHAYYLKYQNRRAEYLKNWWQIIDWAKADARYEAALGFFG